MHKEEFYNFKYLFQLRQKSFTTFKLLDYNFVYVSIIDKNNIFHKGLHTNMSQDTCKCNFMCNIMSYMYLTQPARNRSLFSVTSVMPSK